ncbi:Mu transposase C-terminal domain-containing protein [Pseudomonas sp. BGr12]|uniref:Mu transposase C-terminal domain-containing protein n=1 Tax=Pseudomonas sp. BGr12 TaxID=2936269 RepID=UPI002559D460|nr:Mu transposase C-terminal domain-containing protein [Pseudomonas sp. BJa5]MDL2428567.1 Mu transposase C-terminal domain-containing protein [Pseudomonas sp. BJa5]
MRSVGINTIVSPVADSALLDGPVRVLGFRGEWVIVIELVKTPRKPLLLDKSFLLSEIEAGIAQIDLEFPLKFMVRHEDDISQKEKDSRDKNWNLIRDIVEGKSAVDILVDSFGANVKAHAEAKGVDRKIIYRLLYRYWSLGQVKNAFLWDTTRCGGPGKPKSRESGVIPGRPPKYRGAVVEDRAVILDERHLAAIRMAFSLFASGKCGSIVECYNWMLSKFYTETFADGSKGNVIRGEHPTLGQLQYNGKKFFDKLYILKSRRGSIRWNKDFRPLVGEASQGLVGPCHRYEVDSTIADVYLVHRINRNWLIGRPVLYVVVDSYSRMIVGIHVGLEGPSWNGARHALYNAYTPKKEFCSRYGIDIDESEWPCFHLPLELTADRAELLSEAGETMCNTLGTVLNIPPPYRPDWKGIVESRFRLINEKLDIKFIPGGVDARRLERGDRDYELDAILDIDEFTKMVIAGVLVHNSNLRLPHLQTQEMIAEDIAPTPINIWNWAMNHNLVNAKVVSPAELKIALLPSLECRVVRGGIRFQGVLYTCELATRENWMAQSHNFRSKYVRVWYDPNSIDNCWVKDGAEFQSLTIVPQQAQKYSGYRMEEVVDFLSATRHASPDEKYQALNRLAKLKALQEDTVVIAKEKKSLAGKVHSKAEFKRDKKVKRSTEAQAERDYQTAELDQLRDAVVEMRPSETPVPVERSSSKRSAAFLKLVKNSAQEFDK